MSLKRTFDEGFQSTLGNMLTTLKQKVEPFHTALIVVDVQNDFCARGGALDRDGNDLTMVEDMIPRLVDFIDKARIVGVSIVYIQSFYFSEGNPYLTDAFLEQRMRSGNKRHLEYPLCERGSWGADFCHGISPLSGESIVNKHCYSAFIGTDLDLILRTRKKRTLLMTGVSTDICVDNTTRVGFMYGYYTVVLKDLCATWSQELQDTSLSKIDQLYGQVVTSTDVLKCWQGQ